MIEEPGAQPVPHSEYKVLEVATTLTAWSPSDYPTVSPSIGSDFTVSLRGTILCGSVVFNWNAFQTAPEDGLGSLLSMWAIIEMLDPTPYPETRMYNEVVDKTVALLIRRFPVLMNAAQRTKDVGTISLLHVLVMLRKSSLIKAVVERSVESGFEITPLSCHTKDGRNTMQSPLQLAIQKHYVECVAELVGLYVTMPPSQMLETRLRKPIVEALPELLAQYPSLALKALSVPLVEFSAATDELGGYEAIQEGDLMLRGRKDAKELGFWSNEITQMARNRDEGGKATEKIAIKTLVVPFPGLSEMYRLNSPLHLAVKNGDASIMDSPSMQILLKFKWRSFAKKAFTRQAVVYMIFLAWFTAMSIFINSDDLSKNLADVYLEPNGNPLSLVAVVPPFGFTVYYLAFEMKQALALGLKNHFGDGWNLVDLVGHCLMIALAMLHVTRNPVEHAVLSVSTLMCWSKMLYFFKGNKRLGGISLLTTSMAYSIRYFLVVFTIAVIAFTIIFSSVSRGVPGYDTFPKAMLSTYLLSFGEFGDFAFYGGEGAYAADETSADTIDHWSTDLNHFLAITYFIGFTMMVIILLLNLLIAIMMDRYSIMNEDLIRRWQLALSQLVVEIEVFNVDRATQEEELMAVYPEVIHVLCSENNSRWVPKSATNDESTGAVAALQSEVLGLKEQLGQVLLRLPEVVKKKTRVELFQEELGHQSAELLIAKAPE